MTDEAGGALVLFVGVMLLRLVAGGTYRALVKPGLGPLLLAAGILLVAIGGSRLVRAIRGRRRAGDEHGAPRTALLLLLPLLAVFLVAPGPLGGWSAGRRADATVGSPHPFPALPATPATLPLRVADFSERSLLDPADSLRGRRVRLVGFVQADPTGTGFVLTRFAIACCAADATPTSVLVLLDDGQVRPHADAWAEVEGVEVRGRPDRAQLHASAVRTVGQPTDPYE